MKFLNTFLLLFFMVNVSIAQESYSRVKIDLEGEDIRALGRLGIEIDHGILRTGRYYINDLSQSEIDQVMELGMNFEILIDDVQAYYVEQNMVQHQEVYLRDDHCDEYLYPYKTPEHYEYGSMGGYLTYDELLVTLDSMQKSYPDLITQKQAIGNIRTEENRPIYWIKIGTNDPDNRNRKEEILYTALHHAREANSLSQMIFFMWYLLENYENDETIRYILEYTDLYFIPCVNPDGYIYNESTNPGGGGLWRKNRAEINGSIAGVDLNRNYGHEWAHDDDGSSANPNSNTYRGPSAFSEPETRAVRDFCLQHDFKIVLNYHTFGNLMIYPWGFSNGQTPDDLTFKGFSEALTSENGYLSGTVIETVGYNVNGDSDDWMYAETGSYALTPEVGSSDYGFWPPMSAIDQLNKSALKQNLVAALLLHDFTESRMIRSTDDVIDIEIRKYSLNTSEVVVEIESLDEALDFDSEPMILNLEHLASDTISYSYSVMLGAEEELRKLRYVVHQSFDGFAISDTMTIIPSLEYAKIFEDNGINADQWNSESWGISEQIFVSGPSSLTDSPDGLYSSASESTITLSQGVELSDNYSAALLEFQARWDIEEEFDYAQVLISTDSITFEPLCGEYSVTGSIFQRVGQPVYDGIQDSWVKEVINISSYIGKKIWIQFSMVADDFQEQDGIYVDNISIKVVEKDNASSVLDGINEPGLLVVPNPVQDYLILTSERNNIQFSMIFDALGSLVKEFEGNSTIVTDLTPGIYFITTLVNQGEIVKQKFIKE